jgi:predicted transcriptional regulator
MQIGVKPDYLHGVKEAAIEAAYCGLPSWLSVVRTRFHFGAEIGRRESAIMKLLT